MEPVDDEHNRLVALTWNVRRSIDSHYEDIDNNDVPPPAVATYANGYLDGALRAYEQVLQGLLYVLDAERIDPTLMASLRAPGSGDS